MKARRTDVAVSIRSDRPAGEGRQARFGHALQSRERPQVLGHDWRKAQDFLRMEQGEEAVSDAVFAYFEKLRSQADDADDDFGDDDYPRGGSGTATITEPKTRTKTPPLYTVILMNDDYTPMDFVIHVLQRFFSKDISEATRIMLQIHQQGAGVCGTYSHEIAETKVYQVNQYSKQNQHPLKCIMEKA